MKQHTYQRDLSLHSPILLDFNHKKPKVDKMLSILRDAGVIRENRKKLAVDVGCSIGFFTSALAPYFDDVIGFDIDTHALHMAKKQSMENNTRYLTGDSMSLPLSENCVDLIVCNHVYEHVSDPKRMFAEIYRVLTADGVCYLGSASRLTIIEPHYGLPMLSWLPKSLAHLYMRAMRKGDFYYENLRTYWGIKRLIGNFYVVDYTLKVIAEPDSFSARDLFPKRGFLEKIPLTVWKTFYWVLPTYIFLLSKKPNL